MVFTTLVNMLFCPGPDKFWKNRRLMRITAKLYGRRRNCYRVAINAARHVLQDSRLGRIRKKTDMKLLREERVESALNEHGMQRPVFADALQRCHIFLNRKVLQDLAIWEPRTFKALTDVAKQKVYEDNIECERFGPYKSVPHIITKGLLKNEK